MKRKSNLNYLIKVALFSAVATVIMLFEIPSPIDFLKFDFSDLAALIGAFLLGPIAGVLIEALKNLLNLLIQGTITIGIGEIANFLIGTAFVLPASWLYMKNKSFKGAVIGVVVGTVSMTVIGALMNLYVLLPAYSEYIFMDTYTAVFSGIKSFETLVLFGVVPFNIVKGTIISVIMLLTYRFIIPQLSKSETY
ncbi:MAG: ECF transporter S component [Clostridia bacterium]|nr:ECF transporter S component [Clostridia bacterium]